MNLSFSLPEPLSPWRRTWEQAKNGDPADIAEIDLRYKYFGVNVEMFVDDTEIISKSRFVTLVDLALSLHGVLDRISRGEDAAFGFTESEEVISFHQLGTNVAVSSSKRTIQASVPRDELLDTLSSFLYAAHARLVEEISELSRNPVIKKILPDRHDN